MPFDQSAFVVENFSNNSRRHGGHGEEGAA
jgi:hypothetical protein